MIVNRILPVAVALAVLLPSLGCGGDPTPTHAISGKVHYGGSLLMEGRVTLMGSRGEIGSAVIQRDGSYRVENPPLGVVRAAVAVYDQRSIRMRPPEAIKAFDPATTPGLASSIAPATPMVRIPARYADPETSGLVYRIGPGDQEWDIPLAAGSGDPPVIRAEDIPLVGLNVGQIAPEIDGEDLEGTRFKLSDYRGNVVVLVFYGHWCSLSRADFAPMKSMAESLHDRHVVLLGVNTDDNRERARERNREQQLPWRSWWDASVLGPTSDAWQIPGLPHYVVIDEGGAIRAKNLIGEPLQRFVMELTDRPATPLAP